MPNAATIDAPDYNEILKDTDFWIEVADQPITVSKDAFTAPSGQDIPVIRGYGSSSVVDSDKDIFHKSALESIITSAPIRMSTWRNHEFKVPQDNIGNIADELASDGALIKRGLELETDLKDKARAQHFAATYGDGAKITMDADFGLIGIASTVNTEIEEAVKTYRAILNGAQFGWSIGCKYGEAKRRTDNRGAIKGFDVWKVATKEMSVVGLPSNPLAWVDKARKGLIAKQILPPDHLDPDYAYVFRNWSDFPDPVAKTLRDLLDAYRDQFGISLTLAFDPRQRQWY